jgi:hypothetical protein
MKAAANGTGYSYPRPGDDRRSRSRGAESVESLFEGPMKSNDPLVGSFSSYRIEQFHETRFVRIAHGTVAI